MSVRSPLHSPLGNTLFSPLEKTPSLPTRKDPLPCLYPFPFTMRKVVISFMQYLHHRVIYEVCFCSLLLDINECLQNPCDYLGEAICVNTAGSYRCECSDGYMLIEGICSG